MAKRLEEVSRTPICLEKGIRYQVELVGNEVVVSKEVEEPPEWSDVTGCCHLDFRPSCHCDGHYIAVLYRGTPAAVIGTRGIVTQSGFRLEKPAGAYTSFRILKKNK